MLLLWWGIFTQPTSYKRRTKRLGKAILPPYKPHSKVIIKRSKGGLNTNYSSIFFRVIPLCKSSSKPCNLDHRSGGKRKRFGCSSREEGEGRGLFIHFPPKLKRMPSLPSWSCSRFWTKRLFSFKGGLILKTNMEE